jgi:hypoxia up-regulated 1
MAESKAKLNELARKDKERMVYEEAKNKFEAYIYRIKNKLEDNADDIASVTTETQREELLKSAEEAEEWLYDEGYDADLQTYQEKYKVLTEPAEKVFFRLSEKTARPAAIKTLKETLLKVEELIKKWEETKPQVTADERHEVLLQVEAIREWIQKNEEAQSATDPSSDPIFTSDQVPLQIKGLEALVARLNKRPLPKPEVKKTASDANSQTNTSNADGEATNSTSEPNANSTTSGEPDADEEALSDEEKAAQDEL